MLVGPLEAAAGIAARHPPQHVLAIDQARAIVGGQRVDLGVLKRRARHERIRRANVHAQVAVDAGAVVDEELVELALLILTDVEEHLDGPLRPAARHRASLLAQLADDALLLVEVQPAPERRRQQELLRRVLHGLLPAEQVHERDSHPLPDGDQGIADILKDPDHKLPSTGVEAAPGARSAGVPGTRVRVGAGSRSSAARPRAETPGISESGLCQPPRNRRVERQATVNVLANSARKNSANFIPLYSMWKPATISLSASTMSNGVTLFSASAAQK